jgi:hypothetical protein
MEKNKAIIDSKDLLMVSLAKFYSTRTHMVEIIDIIEGVSKISLRLIDWFVTNYSKKHSTIITKVIQNNIVHFNVYLSYRSQLKAYSKQQFDPFRRRDRIKFFFEKDKYIETTIGQLNFFRWILQNDILDYIKMFYEDVENDMIYVQKKNQDKKLQHENIKVRVIKTDSGIVTQTRKKRNELSRSFIKNMNMFSGSHTIDFN